MKTSKISAKILAVKCRKGRYELSLENSKTFFMDKELLPEDCVPRYGQILTLGFCMDTVAEIRLDNKIVVQLSYEELMHKLQNNCKHLAKIICEKQQKAQQLQNRIDFQNLPALLQLRLEMYRHCFAEKYQENEAQQLLISKVAWALYNYFRQFRNHFTPVDEMFSALINNPENDVFPELGNLAYPVVMAAVNLANCLLGDNQRRININDRKSCLRKASVSTVLHMPAEEIFAPVSTADMHRLVNSFIANRIEK